MSELIVGGTRGLGLNIARLAREDNDVIVAGRHDPEIDFAAYRELWLSYGGDEFIEEAIGEFVNDLPHIETLVYTPGFFQGGRIDELSDLGVDNMLNVGLNGLIYMVKHLMEKQGELDELVTITSTSQWTPRELEPVYTAVKAGAAQFSNSMSLDERVGKTLVVGPSGMAGPEGSFWDASKDTSRMMPYKLVATQVQQLRHSEFEELPLVEVDPANPPLRDYAYCFAKILGASDALPQRVEIVETR